MRYRPEIDGLRAVAVLPVLLFHARIPGFRGGYIGVDVFFVISGFLITTLILQDLQAGRFSLRDFYIRRARRILPALFVMLLVVVPFGWAWMVPSQLADLGWHLAGTLAFVANVVRLWRDGSYFDTLAEEKPLLHVWSLSVEEQFYLVFPLAMILLWRLPARWPRLRSGPWLGPALVLGIAAVASFALAVWAVEAKPRAAYYLLPFRAWELLAGALAAVALQNGPLRPNRWIAGLGLGLIGVAVVGLDEQSGVPGVAALLPVAGTVAVLMHARAECGVGRVLAWRPFVWMGLISYSLYLWHQPVLAFARLRSTGPLDGAMLAALLALTFALAWVTWRFIETPFRRGQMPLHITAGLGVGSVTAILSFALVDTMSRGAIWRFPPPVQAQIAAADWSHACLFQATDGPVAFPRRDCIFGQGKHRVAVVGDSMAASLMPGLIAHFADKDVELHQFTHGLCMPARRTVWAGALATPCPDFIDRAAAHIAATGFDQVIVVASWPGFDHDILIDGQFVGRPDAAEQALIRQDMTDTLAAFAAPVLLLMPLPQSERPLRDMAVRNWISRGEVLIEYAIPEAEFLRRDHAKFAILEAVTLPDLTKIYPHKAVCPDGQCLFADQGKLLFSDTMHLTAEGLARVMRHAPLREAMLK